MTNPIKATRTPRFEPGDRVRVEHAVAAPGYEDIPLGGWAGVVTGAERSDEQTDYEVEWDRKTLDAMHPVYRRRCERDDLNVETIWLTEEDIEPDDGAPVPIEQPTRIMTPPLSEGDRDDRVRKALGLTHDDPVPGISLETLLAYHRYLAANLRFPFTAYCGEEEVGPFSRKRATMTVTGLIDPGGDNLGAEDGLFCAGRDRDEEVVFPLADIEVGSKKKDPNSRLISDYAYWFQNWPCRDEGDPDRDDDDPGIGPGVPPPGRSVLIRVSLVLGVGGCFLGASIGAAVGALNGAGTASLVGGIPLSIIGAFLLGRYGMAVGAAYRLRSEAALGVTFGLVGGGLVGLTAGLALVALPWSLLGVLAGMFSGPYLLPKKQRRLVSFRGASFGTCGGVLVSAFRHDRARAAAGAVSGALTGLAVAAGLVLLLVGSVSLAPGRLTGHQERDEEPVEFGERGEEDEDEGGGGGPRLRRF